MYVCVCGCLATYVMRAVAKEELYGMSLMLEECPYMYVQYRPKKS